MFNEREVMKIGRFYLQTELAIFVFILAISRLFTVAAFPNPSYQPDSGSYSAKSIFDFSLVSLQGHSVRSWPTPLIFALAPSESAKMLSLILISFFSWVFFAFVVMSGQKNKAKRYLLLLVLIVTSTNPSLVQWETVLLGQSLMISNMLLLISIFILLVRNQASWKIAILGIFLANSLYLQKSSNIAIAVLVAVAILKISWSFTTLKAKAALAGCFLVFFGYSTFVSMNVDKYWGEVSYSGKTILWHLGGQAPDAPDFKKYLELNTDAPECVYKNAPFSDIDKGISEIMLNCPESFSYLSNDVQKDFGKFLISNPASLIKLQAIGFGASYSDSASHYGKAIGLLPSAAYGLISGNAAPDFRYSQSKDQIQAFNLISNGEPLWVFVPGLFWISLAFGIFIYKRFIARELKLDGKKITLLLILLAQIILTFAILPSEWVRSSVPFVPFTTLIALVFIIESGRERNEA